MNRTIGKRRLARHRPRVEGLETRALLSLAGAIDRSFATEGLFTAAIPPAASSTATPSTSTMTAVEANGTIVLAGSYTINGMVYFTVDEISSTGVPVATFGQGGQTSFAVGTTSTASGSPTPYATSLVVQPDGSIDVAGGFSAATTTTKPSFGVIQITQSGVLDTSFGNQGVATLPSTTPDNESFLGLEAMTLTSSGQLVVAGEAAYPSESILTTLYAARFNANGTLDTTFGTNGVVTVPISVSQVTYDQARAVAVEPSGEIIVAGNTTSGSLSSSGSPIYDLQDGVVVGLTTNGTLDTSFGGTSAGGKVIIPPDPSNTSAIGARQITAMALQSDGQILLAGSDAVEQDGSLTLPTATGDLTRLNANGTLDIAFGDYGTVTFTNGLVPEGLTDLSSGLIYVPGYVSSTSTTNPANFALGRFNADGSPDTSFGAVATPGLQTYPITNAAGFFSTATVNASGLIILGGTYSYLNSAGTEYVPNFAVSEAYSFTPVESEPPADFDGSGQTDLAVYLTSIGAFAYRPTNGSPDVIVPFGIAGIGQTIPAPGDYTGAGKTEIAAYLPSVGVYAYRPANGGPDVLEAFGIAGSGQSIPVPADYFGTGVDDIAVYLPSVGSFAIRNPAGGPDEIIPFGSPGMGQSIPVPADYFGTGQADLAVYLPAIGAFAIRNPAGGADEIIPFGLAGYGQSIPIPGDYDGSGKIELAVYMPKYGLFAYRPADGGPDVIIPFGASGDGTIPVPGDYTGVGYDEIAVYDPNYADFAYRPASGADVIVPFGAAGKGASLPLAGPVTSNIAIAQLASGGLSALSVGSTTVSSESVKVATTTSSTAVPAGPKASVVTKALARVATKAPAQADPSKPTA